MFQFFQTLFSSTFNYTTSNHLPSKRFDPYLAGLAAYANDSRHSAKETSTELPDLPIVNVLGNSLTSQVFSAYLNDRGVSSRTLIHVDDLTPSDTVLACLPADYTTTKLLGYALVHGIDVVVTGSNACVTASLTDDTGITILNNERMLLDWIDILKSS